MICPNCQASNPDDARFCMNCGKPLGQVSRASQPNGQAFEEGRLEEKMSRLRDDPALASERRPVTMLFCDVQDSTAAAARLDPEEWVEIINGAFQRMIASVTRYNGTVARLTGDGLLALFGAPVAHEDDPQRAVLAGLEIIKQIAQYRQQVAARWDLDLQVRVGINTGLVVVGVVGAGQHREYTALGDAINLAARMEQTAQPGTVQITADTYRLVAPFFHVQDLGRVEVKGKQEPVQAYRVLGPMLEPGSLRGGLGIRPVFVGRQQELALLLEVSDLMQRSGRGGVVVVVGDAGIGKTRLMVEWRQATAEVRWVRASALSFGGNAPYYLIAEILRNLIGAGIGAGLAEARSALRQWSITGLGEAADEVLPYLAHLLGLPLEPQQEAMVRHLEGAALQGRYAAALSRALSAEAALSPIIIACDDLHWADPSSVDMLLQVLPLAAAEPLVFLLATRPDHGTPGWGLVSNARQLQEVSVTDLVLSPLPSDAAHELVAGLLDSQDLPTTLDQIILERAEGNPLFAEEITRMFLEQGAVRQVEGRWMMAEDLPNYPIPATLQGVLLARLDRLPGSARRTLQAAAVIGRRFQLPLLARVLARWYNQDLGIAAAPPHDQLLAAAEQLASSGLSWRPGKEAGPLWVAEQLRLLEEAQLIAPESGPEPAYAFRHSLTQDAAYETLLLKQRSRLHALVVEALEALYPDRLDELAAVLAYHAFAADDDARTLHYSRRAGDAALLVYAHAEALDHYERALKLALQLPDKEPETHELLEHLYLSVGQALGLRGRHVAALLRYQEMVDLARARGDRALELSGLIAMARVRATPNPTHDPELAHELSQQALELAQQLGDRPAQARILWSLLLLHAFGGSPRDGIAHGEQSLAIARELGLREQIALTLHGLFLAYWPLGELDKASAALEEAKTLWQELDNQPMLVENASRAFLIRFMQGRYDEALALSQKAYEISTAIGDDHGRANSLSMVGSIYLDRGQPDTAIRLMQEAIGAGEASGNPAPQVVTRAELGWTYGYLGQVTQGVELAQLAESRAEVLYPPFKPWASAVLARLLLRSGDIAAAQSTVESGRQGLRLEGSFHAPVLVMLAEGEMALVQGRHAEAVAHMDELLAHLQRIHTRPYVSDALYLKASALLAREDPEAAAEALAQARADAEALGSQRMLWLILAAQAKLALQAGSTDQAAVLHARAEDIAAAIAGCLSDLALRESFITRTGKALQGASMTLP